MGNDAIVELAKTKPASPRDLTAVKAVSRYHSERYGRDLVQIIRAVLEIPENELPEKNAPKPWIRDKALEARVDRLKRVRDRVAKELKIDPSIVAPRHVLTGIATTNTLDVPAMREWQKKLVGGALLAAIEPEKKLF
jgi:ribonuclease D